MNQMDEQSTRIFEVLHDEMARLFVRWKLYRCLYGEAPKEIDTWNLDGAGFFTILQTVLHEELVVRLCKLTEPTKSFGNLSIHALRKSLDKCDPEFARGNFAQKVAKLDEKCVKLRVVRNTCIAHVDKEVALGIGGLSDTKLSFSDVRQPIVMLAAALNFVATNYGRHHTYYDNILLPLSPEGEKLIELLRAEHSRS